MPDSNGRTQPPIDKQEASKPNLPEQPVREYIGSLARELAQMARREGDEPLGAVLDAAALLARRTA